MVYSPGQAPCVTASVPVVFLPVVVDLLVIVRCAVLEAHNLMSPAGASITSWTNQPGLLDEFNETPEDAIAHAARAINGLVAAKHRDRVLERITAEFATGRLTETSSPAIVVDAVERLAPSIRIRRGTLR